MAIITFKWPDSSPGRSKPSINFLVGLLVAVLMIVAAIRLWDEVEFSIKGVAASGKVLEHEQAQGSGPHGSRSCSAKLEVSQPGGRLSGPRCSTCWGMRVRTGPPCRNTAPADR